MEKLSFNDLPQAVESLTTKVEAIESLLKAIYNPQNKEPPPEILNFEQAVDFLNKHGVFIKKSSLYKRTCSGQIAYRKIAGRLVFDRRQLMEWINTQSQGQIKPITNQAVVKSALKKTKL